ncbi:hypothetical protein [Chromobacterium piscinae]|uniref:hypothetical protein n=1 Tax=Chromobacterium piscinae TaxID=686831 RepID=UPI003F7D64F3
MDQHTTGLYPKFHVRRNDGRDLPGGDRTGADYLVMDLTYDKHAIPAVLTYADNCRMHYPQLADDIIAKVFAPRTPQRDDNGWWLHPVLCWQEDESFRLREWLGGYGYEISIIEMDWAENSDELFEALEETGSVCGWLPLSPDGEGWFLSGIYDTDDGPAAAWIRKMQEAA